MPPYRDSSNWNDKNEMRCLLILKKLEEKDFPRGMQTKLCRETAAIPGIGLSEETIQRKVGNFKGEAGVIKPTHSSKATKRIYNKFKNLSIPELEKKIDKCFCGV